MTHGTIEETYEYRLKNIIKKYLEENDVSPDSLSSDDLDKAIWNGLEQFGQLVYEDMFEWMSEEDWLELVKND